MFGKNKNLLQRCWDSAKRFGKSAIETVKSVPAKVKALVVGGGAMAVGTAAQAQTEANAIITQVQSSFDLIVPVTVSIVTFFVVLRLVKRVVA